MRDTLLGVLAGSGPPERIMALQWRLGGWLDVERRPSPQDGHRQDPAPAPGATGAVSIPVTSDDLAQLPSVDVGSRHATAAGSRRTRRGGGAGALPAIEGVPRRASLLVYWCNHVRSAPGGLAAVTLTFPRYLQATWRLPSLAGVPGAAVGRLARAWARRRGRARCDGLRHRPTPPRPLIGLVRGPEAPLRLRTSAWHGLHVTGSHGAQGRRRRAPPRSRRVADRAHATPVGHRLDS